MTILRVTFGHQRHAGRCCGGYGFGCGSATLPYLPSCGSEALKHPHVAIGDAAQYGEVATVR